MGIISQEAIRGYRLGDDIVCVECAKTDKETLEATEDEIITEREIGDGDDKLYFCDRCKKQL